MIAARNDPLKAVFLKGRFPNKAKKVWQAIFAFVESIDGQEDGF